MQKVTDFNEINQAVTKVKGYKKKYVTNFFPNQEKVENWIDKEDFFSVEIGEVTFFIKKSSAFYSLFFIASSIESLESSLAVLSDRIGDEVIMLDVVQKEENSELLNVFYRNSFKQYTSLVRMNRLKHQMDSETDSASHVKEASSIHLDDLNMMLHTFFDEKAEQLPDAKELAKWIENKNVLIYEENNQIGGFLIYEKTGSTLYLKYWFVHPDFREKGVGSKLFTVFESRGKEASRHIFWVIRNNENAIKRYKHYGFVEEKMYNFVLTNKNIKYEQ